MYMTMRTADYPLVLSLNGGGSDHSGSQGKVMLPTLGIVIAL